MVKIVLQTVQTTETHIKNAHISLGISRSFNFFALHFLQDNSHPPLHRRSHSSPSVPSLPSLQGPFQTNALAWRNRLSKQPCRSSLWLGLYLDFVSFRIPSSFSLGHGAAGATAMQQCAGLVRPGLSRCFFTLLHTYVLIEQFCEVVNILVMYKNSFSDCMSFQLLWFWILSF